MRKILLLLLLVDTAQGFQDVPLHTKCIYPTVAVLDSGAKSVASGFIVRSEKVGNVFRNVVITAQHAVDEGGPFVVRVVKYVNLGEQDSAKEYKSHVYAINQKHDLAICLFESEFAMPTVDLDFAFKKHIGSKVHHVGFGLMDDARVDHGIITQTKTVNPEIFEGTIRTNAYAISGDSGGPLFHEGNKVIGVCQGIRIHNNQLLTHQSYFTDISMLKKWKEKADNELGFVYTPEVKIPVLPFVKLRLQGSKYQMPND